MDVRPSVRREGKFGSGSLSRISISRSDRAAIPSTPGVLPPRYSATPRIPANAAGIASRESRIDRSRDAFTVAASMAVPSENRTSLRR